MKYACKTMAVGVCLWAGLMVSIPEAVLAEQAGTKDWKQSTINDLLVMRQLVVTAHPGVLDSNNQAFTDWVEQGFVEASELSKRVNSRKDSQAVLDFYIAGFKDGHLGLSQNNSGNSSWAGFLLDIQGQNFVVKHVAKNWPVPLPPLGSRVIACDNKPVREMLESDISPYVDRRLNLTSTWMHLAKQLTVDDASYPVLARVLSKSCLVVHPNGTRQHFSLLWQEDHGQLEALLRQPQPPQTLQDLGGGRYWIQASNFMPSAAENASLDKMLEAIKRIDDARVVVLDTRGNRGGNSLVGAEILSALLGSQRVKSLDESSHAYAMWRVSPFALSTLNKALTAMESDYGKNSEPYRFVFGLTRSMESALHQKKDWLRQPGTSSVDQEGARGANDQGFNGQLALVTDSFCASACLDFADVVLAVPGVIHFGLPTSADTLYIDIGAQTLPSGARFWLPLKVWRGRTRGNNQSYDPRFIFDGDINDTAAVQQWVLDKL
ncbi:peptidase S41-like protein [Pseudomonas sp. WPR_5_2]|uniref:S41 family peptidase n=1 Tax=Pseudomonas sp. WPR_5_2 TaxID=1907371 RepID=UPI000EB15844|nr:S41 family peptidase [Pseudomonas sp. WPR_5_2]RKS16360.1 peptidase S41-like protein [Pseudomonas sp. WPR_5_2]